MKIIPTCVTQGWSKRETKMNLHIEQTKYYYFTVRSCGRYSIQTTTNNALLADCRVPLAPSHCSKDQNRSQYTPTDLQSP